MTTYDRPFGRYLEDFVPGDVYKHWPGKTITEYDDHLFCMITMNHHPLHTNDWFAEQAPQGRTVVVGNLVYSLVLGMSVPDVSGQAVANLEVEVLKGHISVDHVHLFVSCPPHVSASDLMQRLKGKSSRKLMQEYSHLRKLCWGRPLWARGFFVASSLGP